MIDQKLVEDLKRRATEGDQGVMRSPELRSLFDQLKTLPPGERAVFGQEANTLRQELQLLLDTAQDKQEELRPIDVTAPFDVNTPPDQRPKLLAAEQGSRHPLMTELENVLDIFYRMGFT